MRPIVTDRVVWSVGLSVYHTSEPCKKAEPIEMLFGLRTLVGQENHVLDGVQIPMGRGNFGGKGCPIVKYRDTLRSSVQKRLNRSRCRFGLWARMGPRNNVLDRGP